MHLLFATTSSVVIPDGQCSPDNVPITQRGQWTLRELKTSKRACPSASAATRGLLSNHVVDSPECGLQTFLGKILPSTPLNTCSRQEYPTEKKLSLCSHHPGVCPWSDLLRHAHTGKSLMFFRGDNWDQEEHRIGGITLVSALLPRYVITFPGAQFCHQ